MKRRGFLRLASGLVLAAVAEEPVRRVWPGWRAGPDHRATPFGRALAATDRQIAAARAVRPLIGVDPAAPDPADWGIFDPSLARLYADHTFVSPAVLQAGDTLALTLTITEGDGEACQYGGSVRAARAVTFDRPAAVQQALRSGLVTLIDA